MMIILHKYTFRSSEGREVMLPSTNAIKYFQTLLSSKITLIHTS